MYIDMGKYFTQCLNSFNFRPYRTGKFELGIGTLNKALPKTLCMREGLQHKTAHRLLITYASRLLQNLLVEKLARERAGHSLIAPFNYPSQVRAKECLQRSRAMH